MFLEHVPSQFATHELRIPKKSSMNSKLRHACFKAIGVLLVSTTNFP